MGSAAMPSIHADGVKVMQYLGVINGVRVGPGRKWAISSRVAIALHVQSCPGHCAVSGGHLYKGQESDKTLVLLPLL